MEPITSVLIIFSIIVISFYLANLNLIFNVLNKIRIYIKKFIGRNSGFFTIFFLALFFFEQLALILIVQNFNVVSRLQAYIGIFALAVVTTATFEKFIWEYKFQNAKEKAKRFEKDNEELLTKIRKTLVAIKEAES